MRYSLPHFDPNSHKGEHGKLLIVGGSTKYHGAPIFSLLAAEAAGADLITLFLPCIHAEVAKAGSLNIFVNPFVKGNLGLKDIGLILNEAPHHHAMLLGIGLDKEIDTIKAIPLILSDIAIPVVIDADALIPEILNIPKNSNWVLTPHKGEYQRLFNEEPTLESIEANARKYNVHIVLKSRVDIIASPDGDIHFNHTGCPQMRVGGTGDALAGIITSYIAQGLPIFDACISACHFYGKLGEEIAKEQQNLQTLDLIEQYPTFIRSLT